MHFWVDCVEMQELKKSLKNSVCGNIWGSLSDLAQKIDIHLTRRLSFFTEIGSKCEI